MLYQYESVIGTIEVEVNYGLVYGVHSLVQVLKEKESFLKQKDTL